MVLQDNYVFIGKSSTTYSSLTDIFNDKMVHISANASNVSDNILILTAVKVVGGGGNSNVYGALSWLEIY